MKRFGALLCVGVITLSACSVDDPVLSPSTTAEPTTTVLEADSTTTVATLPAVTTTTVAPVTETTLAPTDEMCIKVLQCQFANLVGFDFSNLKLDFVDFSVATMTGANFTRASLKQATFIRGALTGADFTGANLTSANFTAALLAGADFTNANLTNTVICGVDLESLIGITAKQLDQVQVYREKGSRYCP